MEEITDLISTPEDDHILRHNQYWNLKKVFTRFVRGRNDQWPTSNASKQTLDDFSFTFTNLQVTDEVLKVAESSADLDRLAGNRISSKFSGHVSPNKTNWPQ